MNHALNSPGALALLASAMIAAVPAGAQEFIIVQSTTSTQNSGLYEHILPQFREETGIEVRVVAVGTGQAIKNAANCDGDVLLVHDTEAEEAFVASGYGGPRHDLMYNDFIIVGPGTDPAEIQGSDDAADSLARIAAVQALFASRGDDSGTHSKEMQLWKAAGIDPAGSGWYRETGSGMGTTLNTAVGMSAYALTDRASWISFGNRQDFAVMVEGDTRLFNQYGVMAVSPDHCPTVKAENAGLFIEWLLSESGQAAIAAFELGGEPLFFPNARKME